MKAVRIKIFLPILILSTLASCLPAYAQNLSRKEAKAAEKAAKAAAKEAKRLVRKDAKIKSSTPEAVQKQGALMPYFIENGDTIYYDVMAPAWIIDRLKLKKSDWKQYYRLVYNFNKVWPYAEMSSRIVREVDSTLAASNFNRIQKERYINGWQDRLLDDFADIIRSMTISQGKLLCRLVDRQIGKSSYDIVKDYKNGIAAGFWQGVARLFSQDLKTHYDPEGEDRETEELIRMWERGEFEMIYFSIFWEMPPKTEIPEKYR